ncbi:MAG TPA: serine/threonine-protein kinase, partial [Actinomycetospora sp.]|nr:serine/threonine-protein kinase [Actinomycetospora sp.]
MADPGSTSADAASAPRTIAGRYVLGAPLGRGGSAEVHRATDRALGREVALKLFPSTLEPEERVRQRRELTLLAELHHPNLVDLFDAGEDEAGRLYLVMRLIPGESLAGRLGREGALPLDIAAGIGAELANAIAYIHDHDITHRDVKPANILLGERPMLGDFGIARATGGAQVTSTGFIIGTPAYMAPEQVRGEVVGPPADVYALGLVVLEMLSGRREYDGPGVEVAMARLARPPAVPPLPLGLDDLLQRMTHLDPAARPTAAEVAATLAAAGPHLRDARTVAGTRPQTLVAPLPRSGGDGGTVAATAAGPGAGAGGRPATAPPAARGRLVAVGAIAALALAVVVALALSGGDGSAPTPGSTGAEPTTASATTSSDRSTGRTTTSRVRPGVAPEPGDGGGGSPGRGGDAGGGEPEPEGNGGGPG